jgi:hypothetical protein
MYVFLYDGLFVSNDWKDRLRYKYQDKYHKDRYIYMGYLVSIQNFDGQILKLNYCAWWINI